jgi:bla regulator protein BlaR1
MISNFLTRAWSDFGPALGNHLWQSTLFVAVVAVVALAFRGNRASTRYGLWLAASMKFLVPFSVLTSFGSYLSSFRSNYYGSGTAVSDTIVQFNQPFNAQPAAVMARL